MLKVETFTLDLKYSCVRDASLCAFLNKLTVRNGIQRVKSSTLTSQPHMRSYEVEEYRLILTVVPGTVACFPALTVLRLDLKTSDVLRTVLGYLRRFTSRGHQLVADAAVLLSAYQRSSGKTYTKQNWEFFTLMHLPEVWKTRDVAPRLMTRADLNIPEAPKNEAGPSSSSSAATAPTPISASMSASAAGSTIANAITSTLLLTPPYAPGRRTQETILMTSTVTDSSTISTITLTAATPPTIPVTTTDIAPLAPSTASDDATAHSQGYLAKSKRQRKRKGVAPISSAATSRTASLGLVATAPLSSTTTAVGTASISASTTTHANGPSESRGVDDAAHGGTRYGRRKGGWKGI